MTLLWSLKVLSTDKAWKVNRLACTLSHAVHLNVTGTSRIYKSVWLPEVMKIRVQMWHKHPWRISSTFSAIKGQHWQTLYFLELQISLSSCGVVPAFTQHSHWTKKTTCSFSLYRDLVRMALNVDKRTSMIFFVLLKWSQVYKCEQLQQSIWFWKKVIYMFMLLKRTFTLVFLFFK